MRTGRYRHAVGVYRESWIGQRGVVWFAQVRHRGRLNYLGTFDTHDEAAEAVTAFKRQVMPPERGRIPQPVRTRQPPPAVPQRVWR